MLRRRRADKSIGGPEAGKSTSRPEAEWLDLDLALREALVAVPVPATVWPGLEARLEKETATETATAGAAGPFGAGGAVDAVALSATVAATDRPRLGDPVPALAAAACFCILLQLYLTAGVGPVWSHVAGLADQTIVLAGRWLSLAAALMTGGR